MQTVMIHTNYKSKNDLMDFLSKQEGRSKVFYNYKSRLWVEVKDGQTFVITCDGKGVGSFEFIGEVHEEEGGYYLKGVVQKRKDIEKRQKYTFIMMFMMALIMMMTFNIVFIFMGTLFVIVTLINKKYLKNETPFIKFLEKSLRV